MRPCGRRRPTSRTSTARDVYKRQDDVDVPPLRGVIGLGDVDEFGGYPHRSAGVVLIIGRGRHAHAAFAKAGVQQLVHVGFRLGEDVLAHDRCV